MNLTKQKNILKKSVGFLSAFLFLFGARIVSAYALLESIPGVAAGSAPTLSTYLRAVFLTGIGLAGVLAVLMIVIGGIQYIGSGMSPSGKSDAKDKITNAIMGLLLALLSWLILNTINPSLV
ncbi:MAG: hypothetical protein Q7S11_03490 [bacterium]|nr:hypothetical protein [bacterium]